jgi:hypothetical protein
MAWVYPSREDDPWYDGFQSFVLAVDGSGYAHREDRSLIWAGGGTLSWALGTQTFAWTDTINVYSPMGAKLLQIPAGSITGWADGEVVYVELTRLPLVNVSKVLTKAATLPSTDDVMAVAVRIGDIIYLRTGISLEDGSTSEGISPVPGGGGGGYVDIGGTYSYVEAAVPVEEVVGQKPFDGSTAGSAAITLKVVVTPILTSGNCSVKLYDLGPVGTPGVPRLVSTLTTSTSGGPQVLQQALTVVAAAPSTNQILDADHVYEVAVTSAATTGDSVYVGGARIEVA